MRGTPSWGNAGHIAIEQVEPLASMATVRSMPRRLFPRGALSLPLSALGDWLPFSLRLLLAARPANFDRGKAALESVLAQAMPAWRRLLDQAGAPELLIENGHFIVWESAESARRGRAHWAGADTGITRWRDASASEIAAIQALLAVPVAGAIRFDGSGQIADPSALADSLEAAALALGITRRDARVDSLRLDADGMVAAVLADGETIGADALIVAAGVASGALMRPLGHRVPIIAERGYHIQSSGIGWPTDLPPVVFEDRSMIVTRFTGGLRAASFVEFAAAGTPPDPRKWRRLREHVAALGVPFDTASEWIGARPTLPDYLPAIGRSGVARNLFYAFGHQHLGLTLGPLTGEAIAALVAGDAPAIDLAPFDLARF